MIDLRRVRGHVLLRSDVVIAALTACCALALYLVTLLPDLGGPEDSPKFQFVGYVLGTAHPPGYPLYVLLTHAFVQLPFRTVAYRANLFSAVMAAAACGLAYAIARQIGSSRWLAVCAVLALATGAAFWRSAVVAEVYSLAAVMAGLTVALLLAWGARRDAKRLLGAVAAFALGLGNHLTIVGLVPAGAWHILVRHRKALTMRLVAASIGVLLLGVSQYWFIVIRTRQGAPYLESRASSGSDLLGIVSAQRFAEKRFAFGPSALVHTQIPAVAHVIRHEMGIAGVLLLSLGAVAAIWRRNTPAILVLGAAAGLFVMVTEVEGDMAGFITPMMVFLWPLAAIGIQEIANACRPSSRRVNTRSLVLAGAAVIPLAGLLTNYRASDQSQDKEGARFLRAVYTQLPDNAGIVAEDYWHRMALSYLAFTKETGPDRGIVRVDFSPSAVRDAKSAGSRVFAFAGAATYLSADGLQFQRTRLDEPTLNAWLRELPRGSVVIGATAYSAVPIEFLPVDRRHAPGLSLPGLPRPFTAFVWTAGNPDARVELGDAGTTLAQGEAVAAADRNRAWVEFKGHNVAEVDQGIALAVMSPDGALLRTLEFDAGEALRVPGDGALYELQGENPCGKITTGGWTDITSVTAAGGWVATLDEFGTAVVETEFAGSPDLLASTTTLMEGGTIRNVSSSATPDGNRVLLTELVRDHTRRPLWRFSLDHVPPSARARLTSGSEVAAVRLCANPAVPLFSQDTEKAVLRADFESEPYFGPGWGPPDHSDAGTVRRANGDRATLLLPLEPDHDYRIVLNLEGKTGSQINITANGMDIGACSLGDRARCEVNLPRSSVRKGVTSLVLSPSQALTFRGARIGRR